MSLNIGSGAVKSLGMQGRQGQTVALKAVRMRGTAAGLLFEMQVEQRYENTSSDNIEAVCSFPLPPGGVLLALELELGGRITQARVELKAEAAERYEAAIEQGHAALMVERSADGLYTISLGNLMAGESAVVRYRYGQLLAFVQDQVRICVPTVVAPRYGAPHKAGLAPHQVPQTNALASYGLDCRFVLTGELCHGTLASPSHPIALRVQQGAIEVALGEQAVLDRDVVLTVGGLAGRSLAIGAHDGENTVVLASFCPQAAAHSAPPSRPLVLKILVDCSGSMNGASMAGAKRALHEVLAQLDPCDSFSYSCFGSTVTHHSSGLLPAAEPNIRQAGNWVAATDATLGGTEMGNALAQVFELGGKLPSDILLLTDGEIWQTDEVVATARQSGQRVFVVGIGVSPAASFLRALADRTGGGCEFIGPGDDVAAAVLRCFNRLRQDRLEQPAMYWGQQPLWQARAASPLFYGETLHAFAGFAGPAPVSARLAWQGAAGAEEATVTIPMLEAGGDTLSRMAAAMRIEYLAKEQRDALALQYQLVTESTNLILVHERAAHEQAETAPVLQTVPQMLPAGWGGSSRVADSMKAPAVWRRESSLEQVNALQKSGMETYDIPAFLRKAVDAPSPPLHAVYCNRDGLADFLRAWANGSNLVSTGGAVWRTLAQLEGEVPGAVYEALYNLRSSKYSEADVLTAFFGALAPLGEELGLPPTLQAMLERFQAAGQRHSELQERMAAVLQELIAQAVMQAAPISVGQRALRSLFGRRSDIPRFLSKQSD